jgi:putative transposase
MGSLPKWWAGHWIELWQFDDDRGAAASHRAPTPGTWAGAPLGGLQYASEEYVKVLENNRVIPSMSRPANPYDNASCESFMEDTESRGNLRQQVQRPGTFASKYRRVHRAVYNRLRLHSALGYRPPEEFEQQIEASGPAESRNATMVFFANKENSWKISKGLLGKGTQMPSSSPDPFSC